MRAFALLLLSLFLPAPLAGLRAPQPPAPVPITDTKPHGEPERVDLGGGRVKFVTRNSQGQIINELEYDAEGRMTVRNVTSVYPGGQAAEVVIIHVEGPLGGPMEVVQYDSAGTAQERERREGASDIIRERWNPKTKKWETAPERERWNPYTGKWETVPDNWRYNAKDGGWEQWNAKTGTWEPVDFDPEGILDEIDPPLVPASAARGYAVAAEALPGLTTTVFSTPRGRLRVNLPDDMAAGDRISGTIFAEATGKDQREQTRNLSELRGYVVELEKQKTPASSSSSSTGTPFTLAMPAAGAATNLVLREKDGDEVARRQLRVMRQPPAAAKSFDVPALGQQGHPIAIGGPFDGDFKNTNVKVGGENLQKLAESPRQVVAHNTTQKVGVSDCEVTEGTQVKTEPIRTLGIALTAPKLDLLRGEQTTMTVQVTGLEGIQEPVPLVLENKSPSIAQMSGGQLQNMTIGPSQVRGGMYTTERTLTGVERGMFTILGTVSTGLVTQVRQPLKSQTRADLSVTKTASVIYERPGAGPDIPQITRRFILYWIRVSNAGRNGAEAVVVTDILPPELQMSSCLVHATQMDESGSGGTGTCGGSGNTRTATLPYLAVGAEATIFIIADISDAASGSVTNTAQVTSLTPDPDPANNRAAVTTQVPSPTYTSAPRPTGLKPPPPPDDPKKAADLKITKMASPTIVKPGDRIRYTITVTNGGPDTAVAPTVVDSIPIETTFVACNATRGKCVFPGAAGGLVDVLIPDMPRGAMEIISIDVDVKKTVGAGTAIINDAEVMSTTPDPNVLDNKAMAIVWVRAPVPLVVISEFRTRGPQGEKDEFIELYNRSNQRLDLSGWTIEVSNGSGARRSLVTIAPGTLLPARSHLLLTNGEAYGGKVAGDQTFGGDITDDGGIALMPLRGIPGDEVGMSNGSAFREGAPLSPQLAVKNADQSYERRRTGGTAGLMLDTNNNRADFGPRAPSDPQGLGGARGVR